MQNKDVKTSVKETEVKVAEAAKTVEEAAKATAKTAETKVKEAAKTTAKKATEVKAAAKTTAKKTVAKAAAKTATVKPQFIVQYQNKESDLANIEEKVKAQFISEGHKAGTIEKVNMYVKPEEYSAYYVINDKFSGRVDLF